MSKMPEVIDLFSGPGGMSEGFRKAGFKIKIAIEKNSAAATTFQKNHPGTKVISDDIRNLPVDTDWSSDVIIGGFPCKPFSSANSRRGRHLEQDLFREFLRVVREVSPPVFVMENVVGIHSMIDPNTHKSVLQEILDVVTHGIWRLANYRRRRRFQLYEKAGILAVKVEKPSLVSLNKEMASSSFAA